MMMYRNFENNIRIIRLFDILHIVIFSSNDLVKRNYQAVLGSEILMCTPIQ